MFLNREQNNSDILTHVMQLSQWACQFNERTTFLYKHILALQLVNYIKTKFNIVFLKSDTKIKNVINFFLCYFICSDEPQFHPRKN